MRFVLPLLALLAAAAPAAAEKAVTVRIAFSDIDVTSPEGRATLEKRINAKVRRACMVDGAARYNYGRPAVDSKCLVDTRAAALAEVERLAAAATRQGRAIAAN